MSDTSKVQMNMNQANISGGVAGNVAGDFIVNQAKSNLSEAATEIQKLLEQLSQTYPTTTTKEKMTVASAAIQHIENNHTLRQRVLSALKTGGIQALGQLLNHPAATFVIAALEDWQKNQNKNS
jgi:DNA-directed RNA polymerase alpha subunit